MQSLRANLREAKAPPSVRSDAGLVWRFVWAVFSDEELIPYMLKTDKDGLKRDALERALTSGRGPDGGGAGIHWTFNKEWTKQFNGTKILRHKGKWLVPVILEANYDPAGVERVPEVRKDFNSAWPLVEENELLLRPGARLSIEKAWVALPDYADWSKGGQQLQEALSGVGNHWLPDGRELETRLTPVPVSRRDVTATSWRGLVNGPVWAEYPGVILVDKTGGGRQSYELYVDGKQIGRAQRLDEAKAAIEAKIGPCEFRRLPQQPIKSDHYWFGTQDWFGDPSMVYAAIPV